MSVSPLPDRHQQASFDDFYRQYFPRVVVLVARHFPGCDPEDIAQETMTRCYTSFTALDPDRDPWGWVSMVARNAAIDHRRRTARVVATSELPEPPGEAVDTTYDAVLAGERRRSVRSALAQLRPADRQLIEDHELAGIGYADLAAIRDMTPNALRQQLFRARNRLAVELRRLGTAALGAVPVSLQARSARLARRLEDAAAAAGPAGATALGIAAVAGAVTVASLLGGPSGAPGSATLAAGQGGEPVAANERRATAYPAGGARPADTARSARPAVATAATSVRTATGDGPTKPVALRTGGTEKPWEPTEIVVTVPTPVGDVEVARFYAEYTPGYMALCNVGVTPCPPPD